MKPNKTISPSPAGPNVWRAFWALMMVAHGPALVGVWGDWWSTGASVASLGSCATLSAAMVFFALKLHRPRFLHLRGDRRSWVAVLLILALIHADCLPGTQPGDPGDVTMALIAVSAVGAAAVIVFLRSVAVRVIPLVAAPGTGRRHRFPPIWLDELLPVGRLLARRAHALRAPPC